MIGDNQKIYSQKDQLSNPSKQTKLLVQKPTQKIPQISQIKKDWNQFTEGYEKIDMGPQTFFYSFLTLMNLQNAKNVLQVACGTGKLLPIAITLKNQSTKYIGIDIADAMIEKAKINLQKNLQKYDSKLSLEQWLEKHNLTLKVANGQEKILGEHEKFDRIICNLVLMLTQNSQKMLQSLYDQAQEGCLLGVTVWADKANNKFMDSMRACISQSGFEVPNVRSNFYLYKKAGEIAQKIGWKTLLNWEQNIIFPVMKFDDFDKYKQFFMQQVKKLPENQREIVSQKFTEKVKQMFENKQGLNFSCQLYLFEK